MPSEIKKEIELEIAHVLFVDIVGYSKVLINEQRRMLDTLNQIVRGTEQFRAAEENGRLLTIPTGDGMALVFYNTPEAPVECALEISRALKEHPELKLRMGVHSGPVSGVVDVSGRANIAGAGINTAQRVMDCGDAGHILLSKHVAEDLEQYGHWHRHLHNLGECEVKHGVRVSAVNLYTEDLGNPEVPEKFRQARREATPARGHRRRNLLIVITVGAIIAAAAGFFLLPRAAGHKIDKSIAVLPFQNLSDEKENAYFADGMQDDILTNLSKIGDLKVISRTSAMSYRGDGTRNAREIGKALGVATLLEGSVRRIGNRVRVNVQLINAGNDAHIWAEDYDRDLTDVFAIQTDLAQKISATLQAKLSSSEKARLDRRPTQNPDAYLVFIQAHDYANRPDMFRDTSSKAEQLFEQAIKLDPNFAAAFAGLSMVESWVYHSFDPLPARREKARTAANEALRLQPDLPEAHLALGFSYYYGDRDYEHALAEFEIAKRGLPNEAQAYMAIGAIQRRQGRWVESTTNLKKATELDPKNVSVLLNLGYNYMATRNFEAADKIFDRGIEAAPESFGSAALKSELAIRWKGDLSVAEKELASVPPGVDPQGLVTLGRAGVLTLQRKFKEALQVIQQFRGETLLVNASVTCPKASVEGTLYLYLDDKVNAHSAFERARIIAERLVRESPDDAGRHGRLGLILAGLGQKDAAIAEGKRAVELLPESQDAFDGPEVTVVLAQIYAWTGESDEAFRLLDHLLTVPNGLTVPTLKIDPTWDPLRKDPRFQALIDKYAKR